MRPRSTIALAATLLSVAMPPSSAGAAEHPPAQPPFGGERPPALVTPEGNANSSTPRGFLVSLGEAIEIARRTTAVGEELDETPEVEPSALIRGERWQVGWFDPAGREVAQVILDGRTGEVDEAWRDFQVGSELARGYDGAIAQAVNSPWVWIGLSILFIAPFFDPRRPLRLLHLDLLVVLGLGVSLAFFNHAEITASVALTYPVLGYLLARMLFVGLRPREPRASDGPLLALAPARWLIVGLVLLLAARAALNLVDSQVIDIGVAGVVGADRLADGEELYDGGFSPGIDLRGDVYGPANYLAYAPFEQAFGWDGVWDGVPAAHAAAIAFDLACVVGLVLLGRRLRAGAEGRALGWALGFAWVACPWTLYTLNANANDALVAALGIGALLALRSAPGRGALVALAAAAKFGSAALAPLFATGSGERRWPSALVFAAALTIVLAALVLPFLPDGGLREAYDRTLGYQATRSSPFSVWGQAPGLDFLQPVARAAAIALALGVGLYPRRKTPLQVAALAAAVTIAVQLTATHWFYFYVVWFLPFLLVASFATHAKILAADAGETEARRTRAGPRRGPLADGS